MFPCHVVNSADLISQVYLHRASTLTFVLASVAFFGVDHLFRLLKSRVATAHLRPLPELEATRVVIPALNAGWRAGQHVRSPRQAIPASWRVLPGTCWRCPTGAMMLASSASWHRRVFLRGHQPQALLPEDFLQGLENPLPKAGK